MQKRAEILHMAGECEELAKTENIKRQTKIAQSAH